MTQLALALQKFFSGFGLPAYEENSVPDDAELPYITYEIAAGDWLDQTSISATVWYKGTSYIGLFKKIDEIEKKVDGGLSIQTVDGVVYLFKDTPFSQPINTTDDKVKAVTLLFGIQGIY